VLVAVAGLAACGGGTTDTTTPASTPAATSPAASPASTPTQAADDPAALFAEYCAGCHAADGSGGNAPDLRGEDNVDRVAEQVRGGGGGMPSFSGELSDAQIQALAEYVVSQL
jgi:cytochrome c551